MTTRLRSLLARLACICALGVVSGAPSVAGAQAQKPDDAMMLLREADALEQRKKYAEAIPLAEKALALRLLEKGPEAMETLAAISFLAGIYEKARQPARAVPLYEKILAHREKGSGPSHDAEVQYGKEQLARACLAAGNRARAVKLLQEALALQLQRSRGTEDTDVALSHWKLARAQAAKGDAGAAEASFLKAIAIYDGLGPKAGGFQGALAVANILSDLGRFYRREGREAKARAAFERAVQLREKAHGASDVLVGESLFDVGRTCLALADYPCAERAFERAEKIMEAEEGPDAQPTAGALFFLAITEDDRGDFARAEPLLRRALAILVKVLPAGAAEIAEARTSLGRVLLHKGALAQAEPLLTAGVAVLEKTPEGAEPDSLPRALAGLAELARRRGDYPRAEAALKRVLALHEKTRGRESVAAALDQKALAELADASGDGAHAQKLYEAALSIAEKALGKDHPLVAEGALDLAGFHRRAGQKADAAALYKRALASFERSLGPDHPDVAEALQGLADLAVSAGDADGALKSEARADDVLELNVGLVLASGSEAEKRAFFAGLAAGTDFTVSLHAQTAPKSPAAMRLALTTILQRKGRVLDVMADTFAAMRRRLSSDDRALFEELGGARAKLSAAVLHGPGGGSAEDHRKDTAELQERVQKLEEQLGARSPSWKQQETPATIERVQAALPDDAVLVEYFLYRARRAAGGAMRWGPPRYVAYTLTASGKVQFADLGEAEPIDRSALALRKALSTPESKDARQAARNLDERVFRPVRALLGPATRVFVSPDGVLNLVPFAALVDEGDKAAVERYELTYLTSGRDLLRMQFHVPPRSSPVVVANPAFGRPSVASDDGGAQGSLRRAVFEALPGTASEGRAVTGVLTGATLLVDTEATEAAVKSVAGPRILHIATHGFFLASAPSGATRSRGLTLDLSSTPAPALPSAEAGAALAYENPLLRSGLAFAGANPRKSGTEDGILTALEATGLDLDGTELVVLSACETGLGELSGGDGVYGLRRAFVLAGARTEVTSLWKVADAETKDLMVHYYEKLQAGGGRSASLREVQRAMLSRPETSHPYYWASFVVSGDPAPIGAAPANAPASSAVPPPPPAAPSVPAVPPGPRGCACTTSDASEEHGGWIGVAGALGLAAAGARRRRRRPQRAERQP